MSLHKTLDVSIGDFAIGPRDVDLIRSHAAILDRRVDAITHGYYGHLAGTTYARLLTETRIDTLKSARAGHWHLLLKGDFAALQADYLEHFGPRLLESGFPPSIFVVAADWFAVEFGRFTEKSIDIPRSLKHELRTALLKFAFYDLALAQAAREVTYVD